MFCNFIWIQILNKLERKDLVQMFSVSKKIKSLCIRTLQLQLSIRLPSIRLPNIKSNYTFDLQLSFRSKIPLPDYLSYASSRLFVTHDNRTFELISLENIIHCANIKSNIFVFLCYDTYLYIFFEHTNIFKRICCIGEEGFEIYNIESYISEDQLIVAIDYDDKIITFYIDYETLELINVDVLTNNLNQFCLFCLSENNLVKKEDNAIVLENVINFEERYEQNDEDEIEYTVNVYFEDGKLIKYFYSPQDDMLYTKCVFYDVSEHTTFGDIVYENGKCDDIELREQFKDKFIRRISYSKDYYFVWTY